MTYTDVVICDRCDKHLSKSKTHHYCVISDTSKPKGIYGLHPTKGKWVE